MFGWSCDPNKKSPIIRELLFVIHWCLYSFFSGKMLLRQWTEWIYYLLGVCNIILKKFHQTVKMIYTNTDDLHNSDFFFFGLQIYSGVSGHPACPAMVEFRITCLDVVGD